MEAWVEGHWRVLVPLFWVLALCALAWMYALHESYWLTVCLLCSTVAISSFSIGDFRNKTPTRHFTASFHLALMLWWLGLLLLALNIFVWRLPDGLGFALLIVWLLLFLVAWLLILNAVRRALHEAVGRDAP